MSVTVAQMSKDELKDIIAMTVEQKLLELLGDPDEGLEIRKSVRERLLRQKEADIFKRLLFGTPAEKRNID